MRFQPVKCNIMQITRKRIKKISASYNLEGTVLDNVENIKYLGTRMSAISAQRLTGPLAFLDVIYQHVHRILKESAYKGLVRPVLEYGSIVWDSSGVLKKTPM